MSPASNMTEQQLRELYNNDEIEHFLHLFSAYVTEVRLPNTLSSSNQLPPAQVLIEIEDKHGPEIPNTRPLYPLNIDDSGPNQSISEIIALQYLLPVLPPSRPQPPMFTLGRFRLTAQRLYLATQPIFWIAWYQNLLLPWLCLRIFYSLVRRKLFPYPTYEDLQEHRSEITRADNFGRQISPRFPASSSGIIEIWRILQVFNHSTKNKAENSVHEKNGQKEGTPSSSEDGSGTSPNKEGTAIFDDTEDSQDMKDLKRTGLHILNELADLHERIKNILIWRRPASSQTYCAIVLFIFFVTLLLPTKYVVKLASLTGGIAFWHVIPILAALPPADRARLPPAFSDVPTDADYSMKLISERIAAGLDVRPSTALKNKHNPANATTNNRPGLNFDFDKRERSIDWKKWGERAATSKTWADDSKRMMDTRQRINTFRPSEIKSAPQVSRTVNEPNNPVDSHVYPAQHTSTPGLITVTSMAFIFTPLTSMNAKLDIPLNNLRSVKKAGLLKGLHVRYLDVADDGEGTEKEEKFLWVGARDELFARLVGGEGRKWLKV
ncbi:hypothetical protein BDZ94DRAFT_1351112 [Collybia nuda]|uniref:Uncharacterized protein n=1 Tax=Collybia nuda TaxID=64659 RepID=A0A9P6CCN5_9AGAR|nr:hypothetical protein BDZ94DRAFT_1351112 [Collybia nuda]